jgi:uncharacterized protein YdeI (YjbR/CyaY-like superfamily)
MTDKQLYIPNRARWREWLKKNHDKEHGIWLIYYKKHTGKPSIPYNDAVEEALCYGWIDSTVKRIDEERYQQKFSPRKLKSEWSDSNIGRVKQLIQQGLMTKAGLDKFSPELLERKKTPPKEMTKKEIIVPLFIKKAMRAEKVWERFYKLAPSHQRNYTGWITAAKKEETRLRRLEEAIKRLKKNQKLGMK